MGGFFSPKKFFQDSSDSVRETEKTTAGEAGVRSRGGEEQKGNSLRRGSVEAKSWRVLTVFVSNQKKLYEEYLRQSVSEQDMGL